MEPEDIIKSIPEQDEDIGKTCGSIKMKFMRFIPSFKIIEKEVPLSFFFDSLSQVKKEYLENGISLSINSSNLKICDYFKFVKTLFKNQRIKLIDRQREGILGHPDFQVCIENNNEFFFIEYKSKGDSIKSQQLQWLGNNSDKEVWFLLMEDLSCIIESGEEYHKQMQNRLLSNKLTEEELKDLNNI